MTLQKKIDLKGLARPELQSFVESIGEKKYRAQQIYEWLYSKNASSFEQMSNLSKKLRNRLNQAALIGHLKLIADHESVRDGSVKYLFELADGLRIESVLLNEKGRYILCVSTQVGCAFDCKFCATGRMGLKRNLTCGEIVDQLLEVQKISNQSITNIVFMGMGEPFHNYDNLLRACGILSDEDGPNLARKHIVISTSGLAAEIRRFADEKHNYRLAISLNATSDEVRTRIMPISKKWPLAELFKAARYYVDKRRQPVTFEYVLLNGINDSEADAERLKKLIGQLLCKINLIPYNSTLGSFQRPSHQQIVKFYNKLAPLPAPVTIRWSKGDDIGAGCGQLAAAAKNSAKPKNIHFVANTINRNETGSRKTQNDS